MGTEAQKILSKLETIQSDLDFLKEHLVDIDVVLTDDDLDSLREAEDDYKKGKTKRLV